MLIFILISVDRWNRSYNTVDDLPVKLCAPNKIKDVNVKVCNIITRINKSKTLLNYISCDCKCNFLSTKCNSDQKIDVSVRS